jgi:predicted nucleotidyltransferase
MTDREIAEPNTILRGLVGSTIHGLNVPGKDDRDEMGVCIEPVQCVLGLKYFEQWTYRSQPEGVKSGHGDLDLTVYSLRKFCRLALAGNPTILLLLYVPKEHLTVCLPRGEMLQGIAGLFVSRHALRAFLGYLTAQRQRITGERGGRHGTPRPEYVSQFGYDTKYAMHMLRLGFQGIEYAKTGKLSLPMPEEARAYCYAVRQGQIKYETMMQQASEMERELKDLCATALIPKDPDYQAIDNFLAGAYLDRWEGQPS